TLAATSLLLDESDGNENRCRAAFGGVEPRCRCSRFDAIDHRAWERTAWHCAHARDFAARAHLDGEPDLTLSVWVFGEAALVASTESSTHARDDRCGIAHCPAAHRCA